MLLLLSDSDREGRTWGYNIALVQGEGKRCNGVNATGPTVCNTPPSDDDRLHSCPTVIVNTRSLPNTSWSTNDIMNPKPNGGRQIRRTAIFVRTSTGGRLGVSCMYSLTSVPPHCKHPRIDLDYVRSTGCRVPCSIDPGYRVAQRCSVTQERIKAIMLLLLGSHIAFK